MNHDHVFRYVFIGDFGVGKSQLIRAFVQQPHIQPPLQQQNTIMEVQFKKIIIHSKPIRLHLWDPSGGQRYHSISRNYYRKAHAIFLVYDITNADTFQNLQDYWMLQVEEHAAMGVKMVLIGNKCDMRDQQKVPTRQAETLAEENGMLFMEVSAISGQNISKCLKVVSGCIFQGLQTSQEKEERLRNIDLRIKVIGQGSRASSSCC